MSEKDFVSVNSELWNRNYTVFYAGIDRGDGCWLWNRYIMEDGYGVFGWKWRNGKGGCSTELAHRVSWVLSNKKNIPEGMYICHTCDHPNCINPAHLFVGTQADNMKDMMNKGRGYNHYGENAPSAKLSLEDVAKIRESDINAKELAEMYGVSSTQIRHIKRWKSWTNLPDSALDESRKKKRNKTDRRSAGYRIQKYLKRLDNGHWHWGNATTNDIRVCFNGAVERAVRFVYKNIGNNSLSDSDRLVRQCNDELCVNPSHYKIMTGNEMLSEFANPLNPRRATQ